MEETEPRAERGVAGERLNKGGEIGHAVGVQEEHRDDARDSVQRVSAGVVATVQQHTNGRDRDQRQRAAWLISVRRAHPEIAQLREHPVSSHRLQNPRRANKRPDGARQAGGEHSGNHQEPEPVRRLLNQHVKRTLDELLLCLRSPG